MATDYKFRGIVGNIDFSEYLKKKKKKKKKIANHLRW